MLVRGYEGQRIRELGVAMMSGKTIHLGCQVDHADLLQGAISIGCLKHEQLGLTTSSSGQDEAKDDYFKFCVVFSLR